MGFEFLVFGFRIFGLRIFGFWVSNFEILGFESFEKAQKHAHTVYRKPDTKKNHLPTIKTLTDKYEDMFFELVKKKKFWFTKLNKLLH